jgi:hypothetical protein
MALDKVTTAVITDDSVTGAKIENNPTVAGNLTVAGTSTLTGNATASGNLTVTGDIVPSTPLSHRNMIINGAMQVAQRGTSFTSGYTLDRHQLEQTVGGGAITVFQDTDVPLSQSSQSFMKFLVTTASSL